MSTHHLHHHHSSGLAKLSRRTVQIGGRSYSQRDLVVASLLARPDRAVADPPPLSWSR